MKTPSTTRLWPVLLCSLLLLPHRGLAVDLTLARLCFWVPPAQQTSFAAAYQHQVVPILKRHGLVEAHQQGRATLDSVFSRLFEFPSPAAFRHQDRALQADRAFAGMLQHLGRRFGTTNPDGLLRHSFHLYQYPLVPDKVVPAGPGEGHWRTFDASDGMYNASTGAVLQDREGYLWFGGDAGLFRYNGTTSDMVVPFGSLMEGAWLAQDRDGNPWFFTREGVFRYDGRTMAPFTGLPSKRVSAMLQDRDSTFWFGTDEGVFRYDGKTILPFTGLPGKRVSAMFQDRDGTLWFGTDEGMFIYDGKAVTFCNGLPGRRVSTVFQDRGGTLWFGTGPQVVRYDDRAFTTLNTGLADTVWSVLQDRDGNLWFGSQAGVSRYDGKAFTAFTDRPTRWQPAMFQDRDGNLWFGSWGHGVSRYDGKAFTTFTTQDGLAGNNASSVLQDQDGSIWFATNAGASRYDGNTSATFTTSDGLPGDEIQSVVQDQQGRLWLTFRSGELCRYDGRSFATYTAEDAQLPQYLLEDRQGNLWSTLGAGGALRFDGRTATAFTAEDGLAAGLSRAILEDRDGTLWFGGKGTVSRCSGETFTTFTTRDSLPQDAIMSIAQDPLGRIWLGTYGNSGLLRYDGGIFRTLGRQDGLAADRVWGILPDKTGYLWLGTYGGGLCRYDGQTYTTVQDLPASFFMAACLADREGNLWFGTDGGGLVRYDGQVFQTLERRDGLAGNVVRSIVQDQDGSFWIGCSGGLTHFRPSRASPPRVFLDAVIADRRYERAAEVVVPSTAELVVFEFHAMSFKTRSGGMVYRYRLRGYDPDWRTTREERAAYPDLPRGTFTFEVQAVDRDLVYSEQPATVALRVRVPYERLAWLAALALALAGIAGQTARVVRRDRRLHKANLSLSESNQALSAANKELFQVNRQLEETNARLEAANQQVQEATRRKSDFLARMSHDLRTPMNAIIGYTRLLLRKLQDQIDERQYRNLENIQTSAHNLLGLINEILDLSRVEAGRVEVHPQQVELAQLAGECAAAIEPLVGPQVEFRRQLNQVPSIRTDPEILRKVLMNLLGNAVKYTRQGNVTLSLKPVAGGVELSVADTGVGIPAEDLPYIFEEFRQVARQGSAEQEGTGLGLAIAKKSVELLGGTIRVESQPDRGTTFTLRLADGQ
jgi:signal transduction histidine kinase/ligand-binding sensor domain-containing protein